MQCWNDEDAHTTRLRIVDLTLIKHPKAARKEDQKSVQRSGYRAGSKMRNDQNVRQAGVCNGDACGILRHTA